ncbi:hypothetical protein CVT25_012625, partial [Psilocybe cyanescens]
IVKKTWETWQKTSQFIVDSYHYINHQTSDYLCHKWCNPAPLNGSAPNLVVLAKTKDGTEYFQQAFNIQACEQLNSNLLLIHIIISTIKQVIIYAINAPLNGSAPNLVVLAKTKDGTEYF